MAQLPKAIIALCIFLSILSCGNTKTDSTPQVSLKEALKDHFYIGTALNLQHIHGEDTTGLKLVKNQFSAIVAENCMKSMFMQPTEGQFFFDDADKFVEFGEKNNMFITGHTLIWHSQAPSWFFSDENGNDVSADILKERIKNHIYTIVSRYKGRIKGWDVVNEAIEDNGEFRNSKFYQILGEDFIPLAFQYANEADPDAELYYNDYNEWHVGKRDAIVKMVKNLKEKGIRIDGVGMQAHLGMDYPSIEEYEAAINAYAEAGVKVMVTEFDLSALPMPRPNIGANISNIEEYRKEMNPYTNNLPDSVVTKWNNRVVGFFNLWINNSDKISRVTLWGVTDRDSWKNDFPMPGRTDYPLLFDRDFNAKSVVKEITDLVDNTK